MFFKFKFKTVSFILALISLIICGVNLMGYDHNDKILFFSSPPLWLTKTEWFINSFGSFKDMPLFIKYVLTITFWSLIGERIDKSRNLNKDDF